VQGVRLSEGPMNDERSVGLGDSEDIEHAFGGVMMGNDIGLCHIMN
jgi:hypothetical protein